jgi:SAM-dependent methyltransferase
VSTFGQSARYYDGFYADKDYAAEVEYVHGLIQQHASGARSLLDLGCGTGRHATEFAQRGYTILGIDRSPGMLAQAEDQKARLSPRLRDRLAFERNDIRALRLQRRFDCVVALFHVVSYQTSNEDFVATLTTARTHLPTDGLFVFDCWYGPGVLTDPPAVRVRRLRQGSDRLLRIAEPVLRINENLVDVNYDFVVEGRLGECSEFHEKHTMRYFFAPELSLALEKTGFELLALGEWMTHRVPDIRTWSVSVVAKSVLRTGYKGV